MTSASSRLELASTTSPLLAAAVASLLGMTTLTACGGGDDSSGTGGASNTGGSTATGGEGGGTGILSSRVVADLSLDDFTADCDELGGTVEVHPHCGGANTCQGISYDSDTDVLTEHTCQGLNTCTGFSCVVP